jgi:hypothetical protein
MPYGFNKLLKNDAAHGLTVSPPNRDKLTMRINALKTLNLILSLSKDEVWIFAFFSILLNALMITTGVLILPVKLIGCVSWVDFFSSQLF